MVDEINTPTGEPEAPAPKRRGKAADPEPELTREEQGLSIEHPKGKVVLRWLGGAEPERFIQGIPSDDLDVDEIVGLVYRDPRTLRLGREDPEFPAALEAFVDELVGSGLYAIVEG